MCDRRCRRTSGFRSPRLPNRTICRLIRTLSTTLASTISVTETAVRQLVVFRLAGGSYGIELDAVREIIPFRRATRLPGAPAHVSGLVNVRGAIVTVIDLGAQLE